MIRILHIVPNMQAGGIETFLINLHRNIDRTKVQFDYLVHYKKRAFYDDEIEALGGKIYRLTMRDDLNLLKYVRDLNDFFDEHKEYRIVHGHMMSLAYVYLGIAKKHGIKIRISHSHGDSALKSPKGAMKWVLFRFAKLNANIYYACSNRAGRYLYGNDRFEVINYPIETEKFLYDKEKRDLIRNSEDCADKVVIGHVGRFNLQKNHSFLIKVFEEIQKREPNSVLWLFGAGELSDEISKEVEKIGISEKVKFWGVKRNVEDYYQAMDLFIFPSLFEGLGIVNIEAQASDLDEIMTDTIPAEAFITERAHPMSLKCSAGEWADKAIDVLRDKKERTNRLRNIVDAGYDIKTVAVDMQNRYINLWNKEEL